MHSLITAAALVATASLSLAAPAPVPAQVSSKFEVQQVQVGTILKNGPLQMAKTYKKFSHVGAVAPPDVVRAAEAAGQTGTVAANPEQYDQSYICPVTIGSQTLHLDFDTGSSDLWVFSNLMPSSEVDGQTEFNTNSAGATKKDGYTWSISYGDGSGASGVVYADTVNVGGATATSQAVEAATSVSSEFTSDTGSDGLLGLAFSSINQVKPTPQTTFFDTVKSSLEAELFTADLQSNGPGSYTFGYIDSSKYTGSITYTAVDNSQGFWGFTAGGYTVGNGGSNSTGTIGSAIADTGTSLMYLPTAAVQSYYSQVSGSSYSSSQGGYIFPCSASLPSLTVSIGGHGFVVPGSNFNYAPTGSGSTCFGGLQENTGIGFTIFGDVFLRAVYAIFDESQGSPRIGFAAQ